MKKVVIIDYNIGNVKSLSNALIKIGLEPLLTRNTFEILDADYVILPGVGAFSKCIENLKEFGLVEAIRLVIKKGTPFLGICVGMQMLMEQSEEFGITKGLGFIRGEVKKMPVTNQKLPHINWNELTKNPKNKEQDVLLKNIKPTASFYFVHSYACIPISNSNILFTTQYENFNFCSAVVKKNVIGVQFHPEKSGSSGLEFLRNFTSLENEFNK